MRGALLCHLTLLLALANEATAQFRPLFDGETLTGWETHHPHLWSAAEGRIRGGDGQPVPRNSWLCTTEEFTNFELRLDVRVSGDPATGLINSGIQVRSTRLEDGNVRGYQADLGDGWWGCLYDEHRRNRVLVRPGEATVAAALDRRTEDGWCHVRVRCEGSRVRYWLNDVLSVDYVERDPGVARTGVIGIQLHQGGQALVEVRAIEIRDLPERASPLSPEAQRASFILPRGFEIELVASEPELPKPITVVFDDAGRMWSMTATEYPVDANESRERAEALYREGGRDRILVFDNPTAEDPGAPRVFAEGLAMPMGLLPSRDGVIVGQGAEVFHLRDTDGDGRADERTPLLEGFGIQDSHLMPHQFTHLPGGWVLLAQGAFNRSQVRAVHAPEGVEAVRFDFCKLGRFRPDGTAFETIGWGLNNIWGFVLTRTGEMLIQEANDLGYSVVPFEPLTSYPGIGNDRYRPYAPFFPAPSEFRLGGTGLSGLARADDRSGSFPGDWRDALFVANPITGTIHALRMQVDEHGRRSFVQLPDLVSSSDDWFRPIAITFGPDGCLYIVDWYNKIISHNEVPRNHPERDKTRGRVWRVRHAGQERRAIPDLTAAPLEELPEHLAADSTWEMRAAWHQLVEREAPAEALERVQEQLLHLVLDPVEELDVRLHALWSLEAQPARDAFYGALLLLASDPHPELRREVARIRAPRAPTHLLRDRDPSVRAAALRALLGNPELGASIGGTSDGSTLMTLIRSVGRPVARDLREPLRTADGEPSGGTVYDRAYERALCRSAFEAVTHEQLVAAMDLVFHGSDSELPTEGLLLAAATLPPSMARPWLLRLWPILDREPNDEEVLSLVQAMALLPPESFAELFTTISPRVVAEALLRHAARLPPESAEPVLWGVARELLALEPETADGLLVELAGTFRTARLGNLLVDALERSSSGSRGELLAAMRRSGADQVPVELLIPIARSHDESPRVRVEAIAVLSGQATERAGAAALELWSDLPGDLKVELIDLLCTSRDGCELLLAARESGELFERDLTAGQLASMQELVGEDPRMVELWAAAQARLANVLVLTGKHEDRARTGLSLEGPFTVETWVRLEPGVNNRDGILCCDGLFDLNFHDFRLRAYLGAGVHDIVIAETPIEPRRWTHVAVTRDDTGRFRIYVDGELDAESERTDTRSYHDLDVGRTTPPQGGTLGELLEMRVWNTCRTGAALRRDLPRTIRASRPDGLRWSSTLDGWGELGGSAQKRASLDVPALTTPEAAAALDEQLERLTRLHGEEGDAAAGAALFQALCLTCHQVGGEGQEVGPPLDGLAHRELDSLLHAILNPSAAVESGYRAHRVRTKDGTIVEGLLAAETDTHLTLRLIGGVEIPLARDAIDRHAPTPRSVMPEGLLEALDDPQARDLLEHLKTLR